jgi:hypothetical protein
LTTTLTDHRADRVAFIREQLETLGQTGTGPAAIEPDPARTVWTLLRPGDPAAPRREHLLLQAVAQRHAWRAQLDAARHATGGDLPATGPPATAHAA